MPSRVTIADLARSAGVSVATVDRVLNGRLPVRQGTAQRVHEAAQRIGYHAESLLRQRLQGDLPRRRLGFLLQKPEQFFFKAFAEELGQAVAQAHGGRATAEIDYLSAQTPGEICGRLRDLASRCDAIAMVAIDHPAVTATVVELKEKGVPVIALLSDAAAGVRGAYVGLDNIKAGRTAAWIIARTARRGPSVGLFVGSHRFHGHEMREVGFRSYFREAAPQFHVIDTLVSLEDQRIAHEATLDLLKRCPDLAGFYVAGGGMEGAISALREERPEGTIIAVCNELTPDTRAGLVDNVLTMVIGTPLERLSRQAVAVMVAATETNGPGAQSQIFLPFDVHVAENI